MEIANHSILFIFQENMENSTLFWRRLEGVGMKGKKEEEENGHLNPMSNIINH